MTYRDDKLALEERRDELEKRLREVRARQAEAPALERELLETIRDLEDTYAKLHAVDARLHKRSLPLLQRVQIASPCNVPWDSMQGDGRVRHCASCDKDVYDLSSLTREQAEALLIETNGQLCATYFRRADGTILTADCEVGVAKKKKARRRAAVVAGALAATAAGATLAALSLGERESAPIDHAVQSLPANKPLDAKPTGGSTAVSEPRPHDGPVMGSIAVLPDPIPQVRPRRSTPVPARPRETQTHPRPSTGERLLGALSAGDDF
jgi:hypothetical protein